jgi:hypothetical protein
MGDLTAQNVIATRRNLQNATENQTEKSRTRNQTPMALRRRIQREYSAANILIAAGNATKRRRFSTNAGEHSTTTKPIRLPFSASILAWLILPVSLSFSAVSLPLLTSQNLSAVTDSRQQQ